PSPWPRTRGAWRPATSSCWRRSAAASPGERRWSNGGRVMASERGCALVTGAARGIGAATARALAEAGWPVGINYRTDADGAGAVAAAIEDAGGRAASIGADVSDPKAIDGLFAELEGRFGAPVLVLVNN